MSNAKQPPSHKGRGTLKAGQSGKREGSTTKTPPSVTARPIQMMTVPELRRATRDLEKQRESLQDLDRTISDLARMLQKDAPQLDAEQWPIEPKWSDWMEANMQERPDAEAAFTKGNPFRETPAQRNWRSPVLALADALSGYARWLEAAHLSVYPEDEVPGLAKLLWFAGQVVRRAPLTRRTLEVVAKAVTCPTTLDPQHQERRRIAKEQVVLLRRAARMLVADEATWPPAKELTPPPDSWPARPFDPASNDTVPVDQETIDAVRRVIPDWDGKNWPAVREALSMLGKTKVQLARMTIFDVRMACCPAVFFQGADWLSHKHGIRPQRLSEAARAGKMRTQPAPKNYPLDSNGHVVRVLYNVADALKHCLPKRATRRTPRKSGSRNS